MAEKPEVCFFGDLYDDCVLTLAGLLLRTYSSGDDGQHDTHDNAADGGHAQPVNKPVSSAPDATSNPSTGSVPPLQNLKRLSNPFA